MDTKVETQIQKAKNLLTSGNVVAFPTETVYGIGANVFDVSAIKKVFEVKNRPTENPLIAHIASLDMLTTLVSEVSPTNQILIDSFWPGPLSIVFPKRPEVPSVVTAGLDTIVVRFPSHPIAQRLINDCGFPLAAPSVNPSGKPSSTHQQHIIDYFQNKLFIVEDNHSQIGLESTVITTLGETPTILRQGAITKEEIEHVLGQEVIIAKHSNSSKATSPGLKFKHYSPRAPLEVVALSETEEIDQAIRDKALDHLAAGKKVGALVSQETRFSLPSQVVSFSLGPRNNYSTVSARLYDGLHGFDLTDVDIILVESFPEEGLGATIMDRIHRAAKDH
jgi:L-threonylcarbamoyladenylate synthase